MMAESALKIPKFKIMGDALKVYNKVNGVAQEGATTQAAMMDFCKTTTIFYDASLKCCGRSRSLW